MRRILIAAFTTALALPGVALAHAGEHQRGEDRHGARHGERHHARHHHHARLLAFHAQAPAGMVPSTGEGPPTSPMPVAAPRAGTVASFTGGTLTITLNDGSTVSGKVTPRTEIECGAAMASAADHGDGGRSNGDNGDGDGDHGSGDSSGPGPGEEQSVGSSGRGGSDDRAGDDDRAGGDDAHDEAERCTTTTLVAGGSGREGIPGLHSSGSSWVKLEL